MPIPDVFHHDDDQAARGPVRPWASPEGIPPIPDAPARRAYLNCWVKPFPTTEALAEVDRREALWASPLGQRVRSERHILDELATGRLVAVSGEHLRRISELLADALEGGPRA